MFRKTVTKIIPVHLTSTGNLNTKCVFSKKNSKNATSRKIVGSTPEDVINFFLNLSNPSGLAMVLEFTQPQTEMSTRNLPGGKARLMRKADNLAAICEPLEPIYMEMCY
jgi:hypothetical protein